jgi:dTDP-4-dehydrorhamnose 3,5-epimerase-like enzyme
MDYKIIFCEKHSDERGYLVEFLKQSELIPGHKPFGQIYFVIFEKPNVVRGNHYHKHTHEWFGVAYGKLEVMLEDTRTKEHLTLLLDADDKKFVRLYIGSYVAHAFINLSNTALLLDYTNRAYNPANTDRYPYILIPPKEKK